MKQLFSWWRIKKKGISITFPFEENPVADGLPKLAKTVFSWLGANYKLIYKQGKSLPWLMFPRNRHVYDNLESSSSLYEDQPMVTNCDQKLDNDNKKCTDCRKDLIDILICFLCGVVNECTEYQIEGKTI